MRNRKFFAVGLRVLLVWCLAVAALGVSVSLAQAKERELGKRVTVVLLEGLRVEDLSAEGTPGLWRVMERGAVGLMNHQTAPGRQDVNAYLTLGAGAKVGGAPAFLAAYGVQEQVVGETFAVTGRELYRRHVGQEPSGEVVVPQVAQLWHEQEKRRQTARVGLLGEAVHRLGGKTAVLGNADLGHEVQRPAVLMAMDGRGQVDVGDLHAGVVPDAGRPFGLRTDYGRLHAAVQEATNKANLVVVQIGDLARVQAARDVMGDEEWESVYRQLLQEADGFVGQLLQDVGRDRALLVVSAVPSVALEGRTMSPLLAAGGEIEAGSLLTSGTTKRAGLVANYDLAPTIVRWLGGQDRSESFLGQAVRGVKAETASVGVPVQVWGAVEAEQGLASFQYVKRLVGQMEQTHQVRKWMLRPWVNVWTAVAVVWLIIELWKRPWGSFVRPVADWLLMFPLAWLVVPLLEWNGVWLEVAATVGAATGIFGLSLLIRERRKRLLMLAGVTAGVLILDVRLGAMLLKRSVLSYDPIAGARYYGIGNEYMGVLLGAGLLALSPFGESRRWVVLMGLLAMAYLFASPTLGTNAGGALAASVGLAYFGLQASGRFWSGKRWVWVTVATLAALGGVFAVNAFWQGEEQTHIGRFAALLAAGELQETMLIIWRKVELNWLLLRVSPWGRLFVSLLSILTLWRIRRFWQRDATNVREDRVQQAMLVTALAAFAFNDSGVVAAALILLYAVVPQMDRPDRALALAAEWEERANL
jgi:hypothetical protein